MSFADLTLAHWHTLDLPAARRLADDAAARVGGRVTLAETVPGPGGPLHRVCIERGGQEFALVPGGTVRLGFDPDAWRPTAEQAASYAESLEEGYAYEPDIRVHLAGQLSPVRRVALAAVLVAVEDEPLEGPPAEVPALLARRGLRMPSADEWEHACGAGAGTLFRWGDACPLDEAPYGTGGPGCPAGPRLAANAFGLRIAYDAYGAELSAGSAAVHGGDGGEAVCGGYGSLLAWLPLATAQRNPAMAEFVHGPDGEGLWEEFSTRPVLDLR
ncbi:hypothetical protein ABZ924_29340 [Streptomyces sp. NPDC046876]|uniref:hypothetical protein n=1 Tax=Streptomyces sp. NPDC046876 TaxID=3155616 RepID=UPI0033D86E15